MSKFEILEELPRLTREERKEVLLRLAQIDGSLWLDEDDPLTDAEKALLDARLAAYERDPEAGSSWAEVEGRIRARLLLPSLGEGLGKRVVPLVGSILRPSPQPSPKGRGRTTRALER